MLEPSKSILTMQVNLLTKKTICLIRRGDSILALKVLEETKDIYKKLQELIDKNEIAYRSQDEYNYVDIFQDIPIDIMREKIMNCEALIKIIDGQYVEAC